MRSRRFAALVLLILAALLAACAPIPSLPVPTAAPSTTSPSTPDLAATALAPVTPTLTLPLTSTVALTATTAITASAPAADLTLTPEVVASPVMTSTVTTEKPLESGPIPAVSTYRDELAGYELDYPVSWSVIDVTPEIKQESLAYSISFTSWQPQEPGTQGIPEGGSKLDLSVTKGAAATPEAAAESRRQEVTQGDPGSQITFEEPWELRGGLSATHLTVQTSSGETVHELVTAINGHRIVLSALGDEALFDQIAMTLRPLGAVTETPDQAATGTTAAGETQPAGTPEAQAKEPAVSPALAPEAGAAAAQPLGATIYIVRQGDTLAKIAARFGVTVAAILRANPQITNPDRIYIGQRITIPTSGGSQPPPATTRVNIYMIGIGGGNVGCGDQVVAVRRDVPRTAAPLTAALNLLLAQKSQYYGESGLYNALYQSNLRIASITRTGGAWTIRLTGTLRLGGVCDNPRAKAQLEQTALQFSTVQSVRYYINGQPLDAVLSGK